jgi:asparagine synthase (glutamine-hydrolysing)
VDAEAGLALGHRRLSIIDLSAGGRQPMISHCGRFVLVFNGEIYNFGDLRTALQQRGHRFRSTSDTEILLCGLADWGVEETLDRVNGMFAFALWDRRERILCLARDRFGEKPLYYGWLGSGFAFGSELKALRVCPGFEGRINRGALALFSRFNYIPAPHTIYQGVFKLPPGSLLRIAADDVTAASERARPTAYFSPAEVAARAVRNPFPGGSEEAVAPLEQLLSDAVRIRMVADVPLGAFLSGGVDSSTIVALMQAQSSRPVKTFTIGFWNRGYDEAPAARAVAAHLGTDHAELYVTEAEAQAVIPRLPTLYDEPFADSSQIPTFLLAQLARSQVTVSLSGDGGDELFGGYNRYFWGKRVWQKMEGVPLQLRRLLARLLAAPSPAAWDRAFEMLGPLLPASGRLRNVGYKLQKLTTALAAPSREQLYLDLASTWVAPDGVVPGAETLETNLTNPEGWLKTEDFVQWMMLLDTISYLPDDILVKVDRATMGVSLESRIPFLDPRLMTFAWSLPMSAKVAGTTGKVIVRQLLDRHVPRGLVDRPKAGFAIPVGAWIRGVLRPWAEDLLDAHKLREAGFDPVPVLAKWRDHLTGRRNCQDELWGVLMFQAWNAATRSASLEPGIAQTGQRGQTDGHDHSRIRLPAVAPSW